MVYIRGLTDRIGKLLKRQGVQTIFNPLSKIYQYLRSVKDVKDTFPSCGAHKVACSCGRVYIGSMKHSVRGRVEKQRRHCPLDQPEKSAWGTLIMTCCSARLLSCKRCSSLFAQGGATNTQTRRPMHEQADDAVTVRDCWV